jgi:putative ABC transport system permease protein
MNGSVAFVARSQLRKRWRAVVFLTLFVGVLGGLSLSLVAGSRRSSSVVDRYFAATIPYDLQIGGASLNRADLLAIPGVVRADPDAYIGMMKLAPDGTPVDGINAIAIDPDAVDPAIDLLDGAPLDHADPFGVVVNEAFAEQFDASPGDQIDVQMFARDQEDEVNDGIYESRGPGYTFHVAGIIRTPMDIAVDKVEAPGEGAYVDSNQMVVPLRFYEEHRHEFLDWGPGFDVQLENASAGRSEFLAAVDRLTGGEEPVFFQPGRFSERRNTLDTPVDLETTVLLALGLGLALAATVATALLLRAEQRAHDDDIATLRGLGCTASQLAAAAALRTVPVAVGGAALALGIAVAVSGSYPVGIGRQLELDRGLDVNVIVLLAGALVTTLFVVSLGFLFGRPGSPRVAARSSRRTLAGWLAGTGAPAEVSLGTHFAFDRGPRRRSVSPRQAIAGGAAALVIVTAVAMFVGGVDRLYNVSAEHGWPWDAAIGNVNFTLSQETLAELSEDPRLERQTPVRYGEAVVGGAPAEVLAVDAEGTAPPEIVSGRLPASAREIAVGPRLLRRLDRGIGDSVTVSVADSEFDIGEATTDLDLTIVGTALVPIFGEADMGETAVVTLDAIAAAGGNTEPQIVLAQLRGDDVDAVAAELDQDLTHEIMTDTTPARIVNLHRVRSLPILGIVLAGLLGTTVLGYTLAMSVRARARDLSMLRALGLPSRRLRTVLASQGVALTSAMLVLGLPLGVLVGSLVWRNVADQLGVRDRPVITPLVMLLVPASLLIAVAVSLVSARRARRQHVALALRVE